MNPSDQIDISIIIVSFNTRELTLRCIQALTQASEGVTTEVILVDNASADGSVAAVREAFPGVQIIASDRNLGFGAANNRGMAVARGDYFLLLNSDAFLRPGALRAMLDELAAHPQAGVLGPRLVNADGTTQVSCFPFPTPVRAWLENLFVAKFLPAGSALGDYRGWAHAARREVAWIVGACLLVRRSAYESAGGPGHGGFDERFFMYAEETDWQKRLRDAGHTILFSPVTEVTHLGGASGKSEAVKIRESFFVSLDYYTCKHHGLAGVVAMRCAMAMGCAARAVGWSVLAVVAVLRGEDERASYARSKARLCGWLVWRQSTNWKLSAIGTALNPGRPRPVGQKLGRTTEQVS